MSTNIKLIKSQLSKRIQSGKFLGKIFGNLFGKLGIKALINLVVSLPEDLLHKLATKATSSVLHKFEKKIVGKEP